MVDEHSMLHVAIQNLVVEVSRTNDKVEGLTKQMSILISNQVEIKELRESLSRMFKRVEHIEHNQSTDGCSAHKSDLKLAEQRRIGYEKTIAENEIEHKKLNERISTLEDRPMKAIDKLVLAIISALGIGIGGWLVLKLGIKQ